MTGAEHTDPCGDTNLCPSASQGSVFLSLLLLPSSYLQAILIPEKALGLLIPFPFYP